MHEIAMQTCAAEPGTMINRNETMHWGRRRHHRRPRAITDHANDLNEADGHDDETDDHHEVDDQEHLSSFSHGKHEQHRPREHNKRAFYAFMRRHFGNSGQAFVRCMQSCGKHRKPDNCPRELKCGVKRLPPKEFHRQAAECHKKQTPRRFEVCNCLKDAGMSRLDCTFGRGSNGSPMNSDIQETSTTMSITKKPEQTI